MSNSAKRRFSLTVNNGNYGTYGTVATTVAWLALLAPTPVAAQSAQQAQRSGPPLPDVRALILEVQAHQRQLDKVRESYTYTSLQTTQDIDSGGQVKKTETEEHEDFFVNSHIVERTVKRDGKPLCDHDEQKDQKII